MFRFRTKPKKNGGGVMLHLAASDTLYFLASVELTESPALFKKNGSSLFSVGASAETALKGRDVYRAQRQPLHNRR
jgi:hypothetical protein